MSSDTQKFSFSLNDGLDNGKLIKAYREFGRVRIYNFIKEPDNLSRFLNNNDGWIQVINSQKKIFELSKSLRNGLSLEKRSELDAAVYGDASEGFQFRFETIRVSDDRVTRLTTDDLLNRFAEWMSSKSMIDFFRRITDISDLSFADAQATRFSPGDFLTGHDDDVEGKSRRAAYVFGLTPRWRPEWGGLLMFHGKHAREIVALPPAYNVLDLFAIPVVHSVSFVTPFAKSARTSITGWLRALA